MAERTVTKAQSGSTVHVGPGDVVIVRLPENPTTGFRWGVEASGEPVLALAGDQFVPAHDAGVGAGGQHAYRFVANVAGTATLRLKSWRQWEGEASVTERFTLTVEVA